MTTNSRESSRQISANITARDRITSRYERIHGEIYNEKEQARLRGALVSALSYVCTTGHRKKVLDFGCGAGNLTAHLTSLRCEVVACDVSQACLDLLASRQYPSKIDAVRLNGVDLSNIDDVSVDMVATYSVLHHVPDYLGIIKEFMRVLKPGGVVFIDHEAAAEFWTCSAGRTALLAEVRAKTKRRWTRFVKPENYINWFMLRFINPRYRPEGDIHVFEDDHIEWQKIAEVLTMEGANVVCEQDYLVFRQEYDEELYESHKERTSDMHLLIAVK